MEGRIFPGLVRRSSELSYNKKQKMKFDAYLHSGEHRHVNYEKTLCNTRFLSIRYEKRHIPEYFEIGPH